jgi:hypothetical protein
MKARRHPAKGPLLTFALMLGSIAAINAVDRYLEAHRKPAEPTVAASASNTDTSRASTQRQ